MARARVRQLPGSVPYFFDRRSGERRHTAISALLHVHGREQRIFIHNISRGGMKLKDAVGLVVGDYIAVDLLPDRKLKGTVVWAVAPYVGIAFEHSLGDDDPLLTVDR